MNTYEWIRQKCRNGAKFLLIYGIFVVMVYLAAEPADRTGEGLAGAGLTIIESIGQVFLTIALLLNPVTLFFAGRAITAIVIFLVFRFISSKGKDIEQYRKEAEDMLKAVPIVIACVPLFCWIVPFVLQ